MDRGKLLGIILISLSVLAVPALALVLRQEGSLSLILLAGPAIVFLVGLLFLFTNLLESSLGISDELERLPELVEDDLEDFRQGRFGWTHATIAATVFSGASLLAVLVWYKKWEASWGPLNVLAISAVVVAVTLVAGIRSQWFQNRWRRTRWWTFLIPMAGFALSVGLGIFSTEPKEFGGQRRISNSLSEAERWSTSRASQSGFLDSGMGGLDIDLDCDGDECLLLVVVLVAIACVVSSAFIPHYWVLAGHWLLTFMALIAVRELLFRAEPRSTAEEGREVQAES